MGEMRLEIANRAFAHLILDYEHDGSDGLAPSVLCRVLVEDLLQGYIRAENRENAIRAFYAGEWGAA